MQLLIELKAYGSSLISPSDEFGRRACLATRLAEFPLPRRSRFLAEPGQGRHSRMAAVADTSSCHRRGVILGEPSMGFPTIMTKGYDLTLARMPRAGI
jgi:hypothetical protein